MKRLIRSSHVIGLSALICLVVASAGCAGRTTLPCPPGQRVTLLSTVLRDPLAPTKTFSVAPNTTVWVSTSTPRGSGFLDLKVGTIYSVADGSAPNIVTDARGDQTAEDPHVVLWAPNRWLRLDIGPGTWRAYTFHMVLTQFDVTIVSCIAT